MEGRLSGFSLNRDGTENITVTVKPGFAETYDELKDSEVTVEIKKARKHRSLEANAYAWVLIDQIAEKTGIKKSEVYRNAIREIGGVSTCIGMKNEAIATFKSIWEKNGLGNQIEVLPDSSKEGWSNVRIYFGSSTYDTAQMSRLIDSLIQDAESLGIPTITPAEEERMLQRWGKKNQTKENRDDHDQAT